MDLSCSLLNKSILAGAINALGAGKCLYGSDAPYGYPGADGRHDYGRVLRNIEGLSLSESDTQLVQGANLAQIARVVDRPPGV